MRPLSAALALAVALLTGPAAAQAIYRCDDGKGGVLYADTPCAHGAKVDVLPGKADPAAIERLKREQKAFDERQAVRDAKVRSEAQAALEARRAHAERSAVSEPQAEYAGYPGYAWGGYWPWPPVPPVPQRPEARPSGFVPAAPVAALPRPRP